LGKAQRTKPNSINLAQSATDKREIFTWSWNLSPKECGNSNATIEREISRHIPFLLARLDSAGNDNNNNAQIFRDSGIPKNPESENSR
jgi:predicted transcriptional regulator